jgi:uncharacterized protein
LRVFVDTSALYALLDEDDANHTPAGSWLTSEARDESVLLATHAYVIVETAALVHRRFGRAAVRVFFDAFVPSLSVLYVDEELHRRSAAAYLAGLDSGVSFVDRVSFETMRSLGIDHAFAFDRDFETEGFRIVPSP